MPTLFTRARLFKNRTLLVVVVLLGVAAGAQLFSARANAAAPPPVTYQYHAGSENLQLLLINNHRRNINGEGTKNYGTTLPHPHTLPGLTTEFCSGATARLWSMNMAKAQQLKPSSTFLLSQQCPRRRMYRTAVAYQKFSYSVSVETATQSVLTAMFKSQQHHSFIDATDVRYLGVGVVEARYPSNYALAITHHYLGY